MDIVTIKNLGPISYARIGILERGLTLVEGANGSGKSTLLALLAAVAQGESLKDFTVKDGELSGSFDGMGVTATLGHGRQRFSTDGEFALPSLGRGIDPSVLVDPGLKGAEANDARRAGMLCRMAGVPTDITLFSDVVEDIGSVTSDAVLKSESVPEMADKIRRKLHEVALSKEKEAEALTNRAIGLAASVENVDLEALSPADARTALERATNARTEAQAQARAYTNAAGAAERARAFLATASQTNIADLEAALARAKGLKRDADDLVTTARAELARAQANLEARVRDATGADEAAVLAEHRLTTARNDLTRNAQQEQVIKALDGLANPTSEELAELDRLHAVAVANVEAAGAAERARGVLAEAKGLRDQAEELLSVAAKKRAQAKATEGVVAHAIARVAPMGLSFEDGRMILETKRGKTLFDDLSVGERWRIALPCAIKAVGAGGFLSIRQEALEALDPENLDYVAQTAFDEHVRLVGARATSGELTARPYLPGATTDPEAHSDAKRN